MKNIKICGLVILAALNLGGALSLKAMENGDNQLADLAQQGMLEMVKEMLTSQKINVNAKDKKRGNTPLHWAAYNNNLEMVKYLVEQGAEVNAKNNCGVTPLHFAALNNNLEMVKYLVDKKAEVNAKDKKCGMTPLHWAASENNPEVVKYLIQKKATVNLQDNNGKTALHWAAQKGQLKPIEILVCNGAQIDASLAPLSQSPLHLAAINGQLTAMKLLKKLGANVRLLDGLGNNLLHTSVLSNDPKIIDYLKKKRWNVNAKNAEGWTALHFAARDNKLKAIKSLLNHGAAINAQKNDGWTPLHVAAYNGNVDALKILLSSGASIGRKSTDGKTAADVALPAKAKIIKRILNCISKLDTVKTREQATSFIAHWLIKKKMDLGLILGRVGPSQLMLLSCLFDWINQNSRWEEFITWLKNDVIGDEWELNIVGSYVWFVYYLGHHAFKTRQKTFLDFMGLVFKLARNEADQMPLIHARIGADFKQLFDKSFSTNHAGQKFWLRLADHHKQAITDLTSQLNGAIGLLRLAGGAMIQDRLYQTRKKINPKAIKPSTKSLVPVSDANEPKKRALSALDFTSNCKNGFGDIKIRLTAPTN